MGLGGENAEHSVTHIDIQGEPGSIEAMTVGRASELGRAVARLHQVPLPEPFEVSRPPFPPGLVGIDAFLQELVGADLERHVFVQRYALVCAVCCELT
jgi:hypothetical protein